MGEILIVDDHLEACQAWQEVISAQATIEDKKIAGEEAMKHLTDQTFRDTRKVIVSGETALQLPDGTNKIEEELHPVLQYGKVITRGWLGRPIFLDRGDEGLLTWRVYEPSVIGPTNTEEFSLGDIDDVSTEAALALPLDKPLSRPLYFPVGLINYAICWEK